MKIFTGDWVMPSNSVVFKELALAIQDAAKTGKSYAEFIELLSHHEISKLEKQFECLSCLFNSARSAYSASKRIHEIFVDTSCDCSS